MTHTTLPIMRSSGKNTGMPIGHPTGQNAPKSNLFCQEYLTKSLKLLDNIAENLFSSIMGKFGRLAGAVGIVGALGAAEAAAGEKPTNAEIPIPVTATVDDTGAQVTDCVAYVRAELDAQKAKGIAMSRKDQKLLLLDCRGGNLDTRIAEQEAILADIRARMAERLTEKYGITLDEDANVVDEFGKVLARVVAINGKLVLQRQLEEENEALLDEAKEIIDQLASS